MKKVEELAQFVASTKDLSERCKEELKIRVLDSLGCSIGALDSPLIRILRDELDDFGELDGKKGCTLIGGGRAAPDRAAFYNGALVRYLDFNDSYLAKKETCHPSDNLSAVLAACEYAGASGSDFLMALAVAYQVQCRLSDEAPVRAKGFDHTTQGAYAVAAGVSKALKLDPARTAHAVAISGTAFNALRVTRTGALSHWKGLAYPNTAFCATHAAFLAMRGVTGPLEVFEGNKGFMDSIAGKFQIDWKKENLERVCQTIIKKFNAEIHSQSALEAVLDLKREKKLKAEDIEQVEIGIFDVAYHIIGGGEEGEKYTVRTKEEADHSLPYLVAAALLDDQVMPEQYEPERIGREDIQDLLRRVRVSSSRDYSERFPSQMPCRVTITLRDGRRFEKEAVDYEGFHTRPMSWEKVKEKFERLAGRFADSKQMREIEQAVARLDQIPVKELTALLGEVKALR